MPVSTTGEHLTAPIKEPKKGFNGNITSFVSKVDAFKEYRSQEQQNEKLKEQNSPLAVPPVESEDAKKGQELFTLNTEAQKYTNDAIHDNSDEDIVPACQDIIEKISSESDYDKKIAMAQGFVNSVTSHDFPGEWKLLSKVLEACPEPISKSITKVSESFRLNTQLVNLNNPEQFKNDHYQSLLALFSSENSPLSLEEKELFAFNHQEGAGMMIFDAFKELQQASKNSDFKEEDFSRIFEAVLNKSITHEDFIKAITEAKVEGQVYIEDVISILPKLPGVDPAMTVGYAESLLNSRPDTNRPNDPNKEQKIAKLLKINDRVGMALVDLYSPETIFFPDVLRNYQDLSSLSQQVRLIFEKRNLGHEVVNKIDKMDFEKQLGVSKKTEDQIKQKTEEDKNFIDQFSKNESIQDILLSVYNKPLYDLEKSDLENAKQNLDTLKTAQPDFAKAVDFAKDITDQFMEYVKIPTLVRENSSTKIKKVGSLFKKDVDYIETKYVVDQTEYNKILQQLQLENSRNPSREGNIKIEALKLIGRRGSSTHES